MASNGFIGFKRGFIEELGRLLGLFFSSMIALNYYISLGELFLGIFSFDPWAIFVISFIIVFIASLFCMRLLTKLIHFMFLSKSTKWVNKALDVIFGCCKGAFLVMMFFWMLEILPSEQTANVVISNSRAAKNFIGVRKSVVSIFHLDDPVLEGEKAIQDFMKKIDK